MNTRDLEAFLAVVETGSITGASARLNLTQPGVTRRIQSLEDQLGVALLERQSKPLKPTRAGREAYVRGRRVLGAVDDFKASLSPDGVVTGELRLGISPYLSEAGTASVAGELRSRFPTLVLRITTGWPPELLERLRRCEIDAAAFCLPEGVEPPAGYQSEALEVQPIEIVASPRFGLPSEASLRELSRVPWILNPDGCGFRSALQRRFERERLPMTIGIEATSSELRLSLAANGHGATLATKAAVESSGLGNALDVIAVQNFTPRVRAWVVSLPPIGRLASPLALLTNALKDALVSPERQPS